MEYRNSEETPESMSRPEDSKPDGEKVFFSCGNEPEEIDFPNQSHSKNGSLPSKPSDVRNGDLVSLLLAATPPYLYNIPLVPQTFFFSEMLKSFVQAKAERQNLKAHQTHHRRQRKRTWREATPPDPPNFDSRDKPLELTTPKQAEDKPKPEKPPAKKVQQDGSDKKLSELGNFSVEKLAHSSIAAATDSAPGTLTPADLPPPPPLWYPLLYPPHPPYGIDPLHFFIDLRVSAHFLDRTAKLTDPAPDAAHPPPPLPKGPRPSSAFRAPSPTRPSPRPTHRKDKPPNVHYVISSLRDIYRSVEREAVEREGEGEGEGEGEKGEEVEGGGQGEGKKKCKDLRALIGLELVVDYVKQESDGEEEKPEVAVGEEECESQRTTEPEVNE